MSFSRTEVWSRILVFRFSSTWCFFLDQRDAVFSLSQKMFCKRLTKKCSFYTISLTFSCRDVFITKNTYKFYRIMHFFGKMFQNNDYLWNQEQTRSATRYFKNSNASVSNYMLGRKVVRKYSSFVQIWHIIKV